MMMVYGMFVFELKTVPHQQLQQSKTWRHVKNERINRSAKWQYIGAGDDQITLSGVLYPSVTGGDRSEQALVSAFNAVRKITTAGGQITYDTDRARGVSHGDVAWANMLAIINEPLGRENGSGGGSVREF